MTKARSLSDFIESDGSVTLVDNQKIKVGTGNDLEIYHDGNSKISDGNSNSDLLIQSNNIVLEKTDGENMIHCAGDGAVQLYHNGSSKIATTSTGIDVTGKVVTTAMEMGGGTSSASIYRTGSDGSGFHFSTNAILPADQTGAVANGTEDLGATGNKFKDLHLSGSANVGSVVSSGAISGTSANFTNDVAINNGSPEFYLGTTGAHYNWRIGVQENVDAAFTIDVGSQDTDYSNDTYTSQVIVKNTGSMGLGAAPSATDWGSASRVLQITGTQPLVSLKDTDTGEIQLANSGQTFYIWDSVGSASRMQIRADGSVAIGANNAGYDGQILSVKAGTGDNVLYGESSDANCIVSLRDNSSTANIGYGATGNAHILSRDGVEKFRFDGSNLHLVGGADARIQLSTSGTGNAAVSNNTVNIRGDNDNLKLNAAANGILVFEIDGTEKARINDKGLGINFTSATAGKLNASGTGSNNVQTFFQHNECMVIAAHSSGSGSSDFTITLAFETNHLRGGTVEMESSGHKYNNGGDFWLTRHVYSCMSEGGSTRMNSRISGLEFSQGSNRMTTALNKVSGSNRWEAVITIQGEYQGAFHFRLQGYAFVNMPTGLTIAT